MFEPDQMLDSLFFAPVASFIGNVHAMLASIPFVARLLGLGIRPKWYGHRADYPSSSKGQWTYLSRLFA